MLDIVNIQHFALMAYSGSETAEQWRNTIIEQMKGLEYTLKENTYIEISANDTYGQRVATDLYTQRDAQDVYTQRSGSNYYSNSPAVDVYTNVPATDTYSDKNTYSRRDSYDRQGDIYGRSNSYDRQGGTYSRSNSYSEGTGYSASSSYSKSNTYSKANSYNQYFDGGGAIIGPDHITSSYSRKNIYSASSSYSRKNSYSRGTGYSRSNSYARGTGYSRRNTYARGVGYSRSNTYSKSDIYGNAAASDNYSQSYGYNYYSNSYGQSNYAQSAKEDVYSNAPAVDVYTNTPSVNSGFNHKNYVPSIPEINTIQGAVFDDEISIILASYDKNTNMDLDVDHDNDSTDVLYTLTVQRIYDLSGNAVDDEPITLLQNSLEYGIDVDTSSLPEGQYEVVAVASNKERSANGVTETYVSEPKTALFSIIRNHEADISIINASEFNSFKFGKEGAVSAEGLYKKYMDKIYANGSSEQQKGVFMEIALTDADSTDCHKMNVCLEADGKNITPYYDVTFETDEDGKQIAGNKKGVVFIPFTDDLSSYNNVKICMNVSEYADNTFAKLKQTYTKKYAKNKDNKIITIDIDNDCPNIMITNPDSCWVESKQVNITFQDIGTGVNKALYQIVSHGSDISDTGWVDATSNLSGDIILSNQGEWDIYAKSVDAAGNETILSKLDYKISPVTTTFAVPSSVKPGDLITPTATITTSIPIDKVEMWVQNYTSPEKSILTNHNGLLNVFMCDMDIPADIPLGDHVVFAKIYLSNGTSKVISKSITVEQAASAVYIRSAAIFHNSDWDSKRLDYNSTADSDSLRNATTFWSQEPLIATLVGKNIKSGTVEIRDTNIKENLIKTGTGDYDTWSVQFNKKDIEGKFGQNEPEMVVIIFKLYNEDNEETVIRKAITIDDSVSSDF